METWEFVCRCLGIDGNVVDKICEEFDIDLSDEEVYQAVESFNRFVHWGVGMALLRILFDKIIESYKDKLDADKFDHDFSSPSYPCMYYDGEEFSTKEELDTFVARKLGAKPK